MDNNFPVANSIPEYIGDLLAGVWPGATRLEANRRNYAKLFEAAEADEDTLAFLVEFVGFIEKEISYTDTGRRIGRPDADDQQTFAIVVRFPAVSDEAVDLRADGYTRVQDAIRALRSGYRVVVDGKPYTLDIVGGQAIDPPEDSITVDVFEISVIAQ